MNRRLDDQLAWIRFALVVPVGACVGIVLAYYWPQPQPSVIHCRAPSCVIVTLPDCEPAIQPTAYRGQVAVSVRCAR